MNTHRFLPSSIDNRKGSMSNEIFCIKLVHTNRGEGHLRRHWLSLVVDGRWYGRWMLWLFNSVSSQFYSFFSVWVTLRSQQSRPLLSKKSILAGGGCCLVLVRLLQVSTFLFNIVCAGLVCVCCQCWFVFLLQSVSVVPDWEMMKGLSGGGGREVCCVCSDCPVLGPVSLCCCFSHTADWTEGVMRPAGWEIVLTWRAKYRNYWGLSTNWSQ